MGGVISSKSRREDMLEEFLDQEEKDRLVIRKKLLRNNIYRKKLDGDDQRIERICEILANRDMLLETYLNLDWTETEKLYDLIEKEADQELESEEEEEDDSHVVKQSLKTLSRTRLPKKLAVKLLICESSPSNAKQTLRRLFSPIVSKAFTGNEYGLFHSALAVGPWIIEYNNSALCIPRKAVSSAALMSIDIDKWSTKELAEAVEKLCDVIMKWNTKRDYKSLAGNKSKEGNCQDFVDDCMKHLDIKANFSGALANFLKDLRESGSSKLKFKPTSTFKETFGMKENEILFTNHKQLDEFIHFLRRDKKLSLTLDMNFHDEAFLLKSFDRAFWLRHFKYPDNEKFKPHNCLFKDPRATGSHLLWG